MTGRWADTTPDDVRGWLAGVAVPWWIAGGWAIDLWLGRETRPHGDLEIGCFRDDLPVILDAFAGWEIVVARNKVLTPLAGDPAALARPFSLWLRWERGAPWDLEILAEDSDAGQWRYRRDARIALPLEAITHVVGGLRLIRPELQLLYKSKAPRPKDIDDFHAARYNLAPSARAWLASALATVGPGHPWIAGLAAVASEVNRGDTPA